MTDKEKMITEIDRRIDVIKGVGEGVIASKSTIAELNCLKELREFVSSLQEELISDELWEARQIYYEELGKERFDGGDICNAFEAGANWRDNNPSQKALAKELHRLGYTITLNGDIISKENENKAIENYVHYQKQKLIEQACDWLFEHSDDSIVMGDNGVYEFDRELLIESFKTDISKI